ncbi:COG2958 family protein [Uliginosibacterium gangwonense]|uniref:COG2958 family protein n=1 Tax=Uliginosibacterium gangwonense TaxID=392736 RepID=UPI0003A2D979|nr:HrgA protein [Uliginosibacterium gangwonense]
MALQIKKRTLDCLMAQAGQSFTAREIAHWIFAHFPKECAAKKAASNKLQSDEQLLTQLAAEIAAGRPAWQEKHPQLKTTEERPRHYYWSELDAATEVEVAEAPASSAASDTARQLAECDLYPMIMDYLRAEQDVYAMRIDEKRSSNKSGSGANEWLHPDMVGLEDLSSDWGRPLRDCVKVMAEQCLRLWSFEAKLLLNRSNARKSYFQAVSNSSWAHMGYLVAARIEGDGTLKELRMLAATHGIGVMLLDTETPTESQIIIPARERQQIDWEMCNRLAEENPDFVEFLARVRRFHQTREINRNDWAKPSYEV